MCAAHAGHTHFVASICPLDGFAGAKPLRKGKRRLQVAVIANFRTTQENERTYSSFSFRKTNNQVF